MSTPALSPRGMARAALDRAAAAANSGALTPAAQIPIDSVPLPDGRVRLVDRRNAQQLGVASSAHVAERTRKFFQ